MKRLRVSARAECDLDEIWYYIAINSRSTRTANRVIDQITGRLPLLADSPEAGMRREEIEQGLSGFPAGDYIIYYRLSGAYVIVARIIHGGREQKSVYFSDPGHYSNR